MNTKNLKRFLGLGLAVCCLTLSACAEQTQNTKKSPNFVILFADDMGYGDLGTFGHPTIQTPNLDKMADEGQKWTQFYVAASVCTPSRAGIMTGRLPIRSGMCSSEPMHRVLYEKAKGGLPENEITIASALKEGGYKTACIGKWHLGDDKKFLPNAHGFDYYYGIPYSNDMDKTFPIKTMQDYLDGCMDPKPGYFNVPLMRNGEIIEQPAKQTQLTQRYTKEAIDYLKENKDDNFFLYVSYAFPHVPVYSSEKFAGKSQRGDYGDCVEEIDWSVGEILKALKETGLDENTIVVFSSDNGPWLLMSEDGGSAGLLRGGKGETFEGGMREPTIFWSPKMIEHKVVTGLGTTMDLLPTFCSMANVELPNDRVYDGYDISAPLLNAGASPRDEVFYYRGEELFAVRKGRYKAHFTTQEGYGKGPEVHETPLLYDLDADPSEKYDISSKHPEIIKEIIAIRDKQIASVVPVENQLTK